MAPMRQNMAISPERKPGVEMSSQARARGTTSRARGV